MEYLLPTPYWVVAEQELLFQEFKMLQDVAVNESQKNAGPQVHTQWNPCMAEILEEETELVSPSRGSVL